MGISDEDLEHVRIRSRMVHLFEDRMVAEYEGPEGDTCELPVKFEVCHRCDGTGSHIHPGVDGDGFTRREMHEMGPDFEEKYFRGDYDVQCEV